MYSGLMKQKYKYLAIMTIVMLEENGGGLKAEEHHPNREARGGSIMLWGCFVAGGTGTFHKMGM